MKTFKTITTITIARTIRTCLYFLVLFLGVFGLAENSKADTHYVGSGEANTTIRAGLAAMSSGDTLIIRNGTYQGDENMIDDDHQPPNGSEGAYTTIQAESIGGVFIDGQNARNPLYMYQAEYIIIDGIKFGRATTHTLRLSNSNHIKVTNCAAYDSDNGNHLFSSEHCSYILYEDCWAWGHTQYAFHFRVCDHCIARRCVARIDWAEATDDYVGSFFTYEANYIEWQNCMVIDQDQTASLLANKNGTQGVYAFWVNKNTVNLDTKYRGCIALNLYPGDLGAFYASGNTSSNHEYQDCVAWGVKDEVDNVYNTANTITSEPIYNHFVVGGNTTASARGIYCSGGGESAVTNSIVTGLTNGTALFTLGGADHNCLYNNATDELMTPNPTNTIAVNPLTNGLLYLPRIETGSTLATAGSNGTYVGANITKKIGVSGTLWGETGYNTTTNDDLWPWPNEDKIKADMGAYSGGGVSGARGFCTGTSKDGSSQTLTKYIWEYLGNQIPADIYGSSSDVTAPSTPSGLAVS